MEHTVLFQPASPSAAVAWLFLQGKGSAALAGNISLNYEYVDLWSRRTTWGGLEPPIANDSVVVPAGTTVMLDVSPPQLYMLLIEVSRVCWKFPACSCWIYSLHSL